MFKKVTKFFAHHHKIELATLLVSLLVLTCVIALGYQISSRLEKSKELVASGKNHIQSEEFDLAIADFKQAERVSNLDLGVVKINLSKEPASEKVKTEKLIKSHNYLISGLQNFDNKYYDKAIVNLKLVDQSDPDFELAKIKLTEAENNHTDEIKTLTAFNDAYEKSIAAYANKDYSSCIAYADTALNLAKADYHFEATKVAALKKSKTDAIQALYEIRQEKIRLANAYKLRVPILMYHYIRENPDANDKLGFNLSVTPADFESQMQYLASNGYNAIDVLTVEKALKKQTTLPPKPVVITFDDGYRDFYTTAFPILKKYNLHSEAYIIAGFVGGDRFLTWGMLKELQASGLVTIGGHTEHHLSLPAQKLETVRTELTQSKKELENNLGIKITDFCYPYGSFNAKVASEVEKAGYLDATTTVSGLYQIEGNYFNMPRVRVSGGETLATFTSRL